MSVFRMAVPVGAAACALGLSTSSAHAADIVGPEQISFMSAVSFSVPFPTALPIGANDWSCRPSAAHPRPVVLVHGTWANQYNSFSRLSPTLKRAGYCVFTLNFGDENTSLLGKIPGLYGTQSVAASGQEVGAFVERVRFATGAAQVDMAGWSQGGVVIRSYLKDAGGANAADPSQNKVRNVITYGTPHHGTSLSGLATMAKVISGRDVASSAIGPAAQDQTTGSAFITDLNAGGDTMPGISYTVIGTRYDQVSTPMSTTFLQAGPGATVSNVVLQDGCPVDLSDHLSLTYSPRVIGYTLKALDPSAPKPPCVPRVPTL